MGALVAVVETANVTVSPQFGSPLPFVSVTMTRLRLLPDPPPPPPPGLPARAVGTNTTASAAIDRARMVRGRVMAARVPFVGRESGRRRVPRSSSEPVRRASPGPRDREVADQRDAASRVAAETETEPSSLRRGRVAPQLEPQVRFVG